MFDAWRVNSKKMKDQAQKARFVKDKEVDAAPKLTASQIIKFTICDAALQNNSRLQNVYDVGYDQYNIFSPPLNRQLWTQQWLPDSKWQDIGYMWKSGPKPERKEENDDGHSDGEHDDAYCLPEYTEDWRDLCHFYSYEEDYVDVEEIIWQMHGKKHAQQHGQRLKQAAATEFDWGSFFFGNDPSPPSNATNDNDSNIIATNDTTLNTIDSQPAPPPHSQSSSQTASNPPPITPAPQQRQAMEMATPHSDEVPPSKTDNSQRHKPVINNYFISPTAMQHDQLYA